jgi:hypothetical protein
MSDTLNFTEIDTQHIELLPGRTVMSMFRTAGTTGGTSTAPASGNSAPAGKGNMLDVVGKLLTSNPFELFDKFAKALGS